MLSILYRLGIRIKCICELHKVASYHTIKFVVVPASTDLHLWTMDIVTPVCTAILRDNHAGMSGLAYVSQLPRMPFSRGRLPLFISIPALPFGVASTTPSLSSRPMPSIVHADCSGCQRSLLQLLHCTVSLILDMHQVSSNCVGYHHIYIPKIKPTLDLLFSRPHC